MTLANKNGAELVAANATPKDEPKNIVARKRTGSGKAPAILPDPETFDAVVPAELKRNNVVWCSELREGGTDPETHSTKVLFTNTGNRASSTDPNTWFEYSPGAVREALAAGYDGLGTVMTGDGLAGVDIDDCVEAGRIKPEAQRIVDRLASYTEFTPSGTGVRVFVKATMDNLEGHRFNCGDFEVEFYDRGRFFTVTGQHVPGTPATIEPRQAELEQVHAETKARKAAPATRAIVAKAPAAFDKLFAGDVDYLADRYPSSDPGKVYDASRADQALANILARKFDGNYDSIEAVFSASELGKRDKWNREDYRRTTIEKAIANCVTTPAHEANGNVDPDDWRSLFHTYEETVNAPPLKFAVEGFLQEAGITFFGGLAGHGKTLIMLNVVKALLEGGKLWNHFRVNGTSKRVLYLVPESGLGPFVYRLKLFGLLDYVKTGRLFYRTLSARDGMRVSLGDPRILKAAEGADVFLDTAIRFMTGEENSASDHRAFADLLFNLQGAGARTIVGAHHSPKAFETREMITLENALRGSGDVGAMLATCWAVKQINAEANRLFVKNVKARDFDSCKPFEIEGRPWIDQTGAFKMTAPPGTAVMPAQNHGKPQKWELARALRRDGNTLADIASKLQVGLRTVERWNSEGKLDSKKPASSDDGTGLNDDDLPFEAVS